MKCQLYRSLDRPSAFFGIRGRFLTWFGFIAGGVMVVSFIIGSFTSSFFGFLVFFGLGAAAYGFILSLQSRSSDRVLTMKVNSRRYPSFFRVPSYAFRHLWRRDVLDNKY